MAAQDGLGVRVGRRLSAGRLTGVALVAVLVTELIVTLIAFAGGAMVPERAADPGPGLGDAVSPIVSGSPTAAPTPTPTPTPVPTMTRPPATTPPVTGPAANVAAAASYAGGRDVRTGVAVLDLKTGDYYCGGDCTGLFGSASVMKVLIAVKLLANGQMTGNTAVLAESMIERSDDNAVNTLWPMVGGPDIINWVKAHYDIPFLGTPNTKSGFWGNTHITAKGMVYLYQAIAGDPQVGPWLMNAMRHAAPTAADGTNQFFGIPSATAGFAVKQGWGEHSADNTANAVINSTGYVNGDRFAVAILGEGRGYNPSTNAAGYNANLAAVVTQEARLILPGGQIRSPAPMTGRIPPAPGLGLL